MMMMLMVMLMLVLVVVFGRDGGGSVAVILMMLVAMEAATMYRDHHFVRMFFVFVCTISYMKKEMECQHLPVPLPPVSIQLIRCVTEMVA